MAKKYFDKSVLLNQQEIAEKTIQQAQAIIQRNIGILAVIKNLLDNYEIAESKQIIEQTDAAV